MRPRLPSPVLLPALAVVVAVVALVALAVLAAGCARDVAAVYPARGGPCGTIVVDLTRPTSDLSVVVNGALVVSHRHTRHVVVSGVPAGPARVDVAFGGGPEARAEHHAVVDVVPGAETAVAVPGPERSLAGAVENGLVNAGYWVFLGFVYAALLT
jgi:hypothetical protein